MEYAAAVPALWATQRRRDDADASDSLWHRWPLASMTAESRDKQLVGDDGCHGYGEGFGVDCVDQLGMG